MCHSRWGAQGVIAVDTKRFSSRYLVRDDAEQAEAARVLLEGTDTRASQGSSVVRLRLRWSGCWSAPIGSLAARYRMW